MFTRARNFLAAVMLSAAFLSPAQAADSPVANFPAASALGGTEIFYCIQAGGNAKCTPTQISTYVLSLMGTGMSTFLGTPSSANLRAAVTDETGTGALVFGTAPTIAGGSITGLTGFGVRSSGAAFDVRFAATEALTADRTVTWVLGDASRTITLGGNVSLAGTFALSGAFSFTGTLTGATTVTFPTTGTLATQAGSETFTNKTFVCANQVSCVVRIASDVSGLGANVATALGVNVGSAGAVVVNGGVGGTPSSITLTNGTGLPISTGVSGMAAGIASWLTTPSSANLAAAVTDETGSGALVFGTAPTISSLNATTAMTLAYLAGGGTQCLHINNAGAITGTGSDCGSGGSGMTQLTGDVTAGPGSGSQVATLASVITAGGPTGSATVVPVITYDAKGRLTAVSTATIAPPVSSLTGAGTGVNTALGVNVGTAGSFVVNGGALGTPSSGVATNLTGTASGLTAGDVANASVIAKVLTGYTSGAGTISATDSILSAIQKLNGNDGLKAPLASPALTGTPTAPTATVGTNTTQIATTAFVLANATGGTAANPSATAGPAANNGVAPTFMRSDASPAIQLGTSSQKGLVQCDGTTIICSSGVISAPAVSTSRTVTGSTDTILASDLGNVVFYNSASAIAVTLPAPSGSFANGFFFTACQINNGIPTITPASGTIGGGSSKALPTGGTAADPVCFAVQSNGTNYNILPSYMVNASLLTAGTIANARLPIGTSGANLPLLNGNNTWSGTQTFGSVLGTVTTQSGTTYTFASTDCGTLVRFSNASAVTATIPQGLPVGCNIAVMQAAAGQVSVNGSAVTPATLQSAHSYTKTFGAGAIIGLSIDATNHATLTGDGA